MSSASQGIGPVTRIGDLRVGDEFRLPEGIEGTVVARLPQKMQVVVDGQRLGRAMTLEHGHEVEALGTRSPHYALGRERATAKRTNDELEGR
jgi:hypothetical protein